MCTEPPSLPQMPGQDNTRHSVFCTCTDL